MKITAALLREWSACWDDARIEGKLASHDGSMTPSQIAADESIGLDDRLWVVCRALCYVDEGKARLFAIDSARLVAHLAGSGNNQAAYLSLLDELTRIERDVESGQRAAAYAYAAAWAAARAAARDAARDAARAAAWDAELRKAIARALECLRGEA